MMVAMAARRAIEAGAPLGELSPRLQRSFAASSPAALARILAADRQRLTVTQLLADFDATAPMLRERPVMSWDRLRSEISTLFVIRSADTPPPTVDAQLQVARDYLASGNVKAALRMVAALPGAANAQGWMAEARRFVETQAALDEIDQAALTMPSAAISAAPAPAPAPQATEEPGSSDPPRP
jgi:hypothetical protein